MSRDRLVSTSVLRERREKLRAEIQEQKKVRADDDPFFRITAWMLAEWEQAEKDAAKEYVPTTEAATLTGWAPQTLRKWAEAARSGEPLPEGWESLQARKDGGEWVYVVSTIPVKRTNAA